MPTSKTISVIIPVFNPEPDHFRRTLRSLVAQTSSDFEVCISDAGDQKVKNIVDEFAPNLDIKYTSSKKQLKISANTNHACKLAQGDYLLFLDHDDTLAEDTIEMFCSSISASHPDVIYADECVIDQNGRVLKYAYKPDFSLDLLYSANYICHPLCVKRNLAEQVQLFRSGYDGAQDYDFVLRLTERTTNIIHIPQLLYYWYAHPGSTASNADSKPYAQTAGLNALNDHLKRQYHGKAHAVATDALFQYQTIFDTFNQQKVEIIIPFRDGKEMTAQCVESILQHSQQYNYSITLLDNRSQQAKTKTWLSKIRRNPHVKVLSADFDFNWSKLQNFGIEHSDAEVFVLLNNDTIVNDDNWLQVLCSNALRQDIGVVGPLLLYPDQSIQHAGVVVGLGGYADHLFRGVTLADAINTHYFIAPTSPRNVTAVTGACMAISRSTLDAVGPFDEHFIICGSDVELCLRAHRAGLRNLYTPFTTLTHLESKTRDTYIPEVDFKLSEQAYQEFWDAGDPFFNPNLSLESLLPIPRQFNATPSETPSPLYRRALRRLRRVMKRNPLLVKAYRTLYHIDAKERSTPVMRQTVIRPVPVPAGKKPRINLVIPTISKKKIFGGISTALKFLDSFDPKVYDKRIIVQDLPIKSSDLGPFAKYQYTNGTDATTYASLQITDSPTGENPFIEVAPDDIFITTAWWTTRSFIPIVQWQQQYYQFSHPHNLIYLIQDYEPGFYAWSSDYINAESTYHSELPITAVFNSSELKDYFEQQGYHFDQTYCFNPILSDALKEHLLNDPDKMRKKQVIVYGRPSVPRNAFDMIMYALRQVFADRADASSWTLISMGESHPNVYITDSLTLKSVGKLSLSEYAHIMEESYLGISLMISPHPSYPPLEMSSFGVRTITNSFANKDLSNFNSNIISVKDCNPDLLVETLRRELDGYNPDTSKKAINQSYIEADHQFETIAADIGKHLSVLAQKSKRGSQCQ